ncbi:protein kinase [Candidatus Uabimicrobium sp. HlEnr_7]|uniref:protein kinase domain-containing protein n=1 Tax=Candidatus Uabimicrobium helgolandensis TaxID=3095367 RepID=UPI003557E304
MVSEQDKTFIQRVIQLNYATREQIQECLALHKINASKSMADILLEKSYLSQQQVVELMSKTTTNLHFSTGLFSSKILSGNILFQRYEVIKELGRGGMGIVYKAKDLHLQRIVALKMLLESNSDDVAVKRFLREAQTCAQLKHANLVELYDSNVEHGRYFFTMEFIEGPTLKKYAEQNRLSTNQITELMIKMCAGIHYAHSKGVIHRDLKLQNIMIKGSSEPKIMDFGLAKTAENTKLSKSGAIVGTLVYMPPEQLSGKKRELDLRSDVYSLGAILYELLTGRPPFQGSYFNLLNSVLNHKPIPPSEVKPYVSKSLEVICLKAMQKDKNDRYASADKMMRDLKKVLAGNKISQDKWQSLKNIKTSQTIILLVIAVCGFFVGRTQTVNTKVLSQNNKISKVKTLPTKIPKNIWQSCWKTSYFDFTNEIWTRLETSKQNSYSRNYQKWYAAQQNLKVAKTLDISGQKIHLQLVPPGKFTMGQKNDRTLDNAAHSVIISKPFYATKNKLNYRTFTKLLKTNPKPDFPRLSWQDAIDYSSILGLSLPSEAQWEFMFKAGISDDKFLAENNSWGLQNFNHIGEWCLDRTNIANPRGKKYILTPNTYVDGNVDPLSLKGEKNIFRKFGIKRYTNSLELVEVRLILPIIVPGQPSVEQLQVPQEKVIASLRQQPGKKKIEMVNANHSLESFFWNPRHNRFIVNQFRTKFNLQEVPEELFIYYYGLVSYSTDETGASIPGVITIQINGKILENQSRWPYKEPILEIWCVDKSMLRKGENEFFVSHIGGTHVWFDWLEITARVK